MPADIAGKILWKLTARLRAHVFVRLFLAGNAAVAVYYSVVMKVPDPSREHLRLREEYSRMMDGELERIALDEVDLTDEARHALREEMSVRGLCANAGPQVGSNAEAREAQSDGLSVLRRFATVSEALVAKGLLESAGIASRIADEYVLGANPFLSDALGGVRLFVNGNDFNEAAKLMDEPILDEIDVDGVGKYVQPTCPQCHSLDITFGELKGAAKITLPLGLPLPVGANEWLCHKCGCRWTDSEQE